METLLASVKNADGKRFTHAELARALNVSEQVITNWAARGISMEGALTAQLAFQQDANFILGKLPHPMMRSMDARDQTLGGVQENEPSVAYLPAPPRDEIYSEVEALFSQLDEAGKREWLGDLRGFVRAKRPHSNGHPATVARKK